MENLINIFTFLLYLVPQSIFIMGLYIAANGSTYTTPNGKEEHSDEILYFIKRFLNTNTIKKNYYVGKELEKITKKIINNYSIENYTEAYFAAIQFPNNLDKIISDKAKKIIENTENIHLFFSANLLKIYNEKKVYKFSKYLRYPILGCYKCMGSFWGLFTFLIPVFVITDNFWISVLLYFANTASLTFINNQLGKKI